MIVYCSLSMAYCE